MSFLSNLFYRQRPTPAPQFSNRQRIFLAQNMMEWDNDFLLSSAFEKYYINKGVVVNRNDRRVDLYNVILDGSKLPRSKNRQDEKATRLQINLGGWDIIGGVFDDIPGGNYVVSTNTSYKKCWFLEIGEDAISNPRSTGLSDHYNGLQLIQCNFYNRSEKDGGDKSVQLNNANGVIIRQCFLTGGITGMRLGESRDKLPSRVVVEQTTFDNIPTAINASGILSISHGGNVYKNVKKQIQKSGQVTY